MLVEFDSMEVVHAVLEPDKYRGTGAVIIDDCRQLIASLSRVTIQHCLREANGVSHLLARHGVSQGFGEVWLVDPPFFLLHVLVDDRVIIQ